MLCAGEVVGVSSVESPIVAVATCNSLESGCTIGSSVSSSRTDGDDSAQFADVLGTLDGAWDGTNVQQRFDQVGSGQVYVFGKVAVGSGHFVDRLLRNILCRLGLLCLAVNLRLVETFSTGWSLDSSISICSFLVS